MRNGGRSASILRVDDNANDIELTLEALNEVRLPNQIDAARTGQQALDHVFGRGLWAGRGRHPLSDLVVAEPV